MSDTYNTSPGSAGKIEEIRRFLPMAQNQDEFRILSIKDFLKRYGEAIKSAYTTGFYSLVWIERGSGRFTADSIELSFGPRTILCMSPQQVMQFHEWTDVEGSIITFGKDFLFNNSLHDTKEIKYNLFHQFSVHPCRFLQDEITPLLHQLQQQMKEKVSEPESALRYNNDLRNLLWLFLHEIGKYSTQTPDGKNGNNLECHATDRLYLQFCEAMEEHIVSLHSVKEYARLLHVSSKSLTQSTMKSVHFTPLYLIHKRLMTEAVRLLKYTDLPTKEIAYRLGFNDVSYFVKMFKRHMGETPGFFRNK